MRAIIHLPIAVALALGGVADAWAQPTEPQAPPEVGPAIQEPEPEYTPFCISGGLRCHAILLTDLHLRLGTPNHAIDLDAGLLVNLDRSAFGVTFGTFAAHGPDAASVKLHFRRWVLDRASIGIAPIITTNPGGGGVEVSFDFANSIGVAAGVTAFHADGQYQIAATAGIKLSGWAVLGLAYVVYRLTRCWEALGDSASNSC